MAQFTHLHVHSHYSILDGMSKVPDLIKKCKKNGMYAMALTDHGNMYGIKDLVDTVKKENGKEKDAIKEQQKILSNDTTTPEERAEAEHQIALLQSQIFKPIIGIEAYVARRTLYDKDKNFKSISPKTGKERVVDRSGWHLILLAKNKKGYQSLCKLASIAYTDGFYDRPRIDHNVLEKWHEGGGDRLRHLYGGRIGLVRAVVPGIHLFLFLHAGGIHYRCAACAEEERCMDRANVSDRRHGYSLL